LFAGDAALFAGDPALFAGDAALFAGCVACAGDVLFAGCAVACELAGYVLVGPACVPALAGGAPWVPAFVGCDVAPSDATGYDASGASV